jgi:outer membrane protein insertion porin family
MKHYFACILLLLMSVPFAAQVRLPTLQRSTQNLEAKKEQKQPSEGRRIVSLEFRGNQHFSSESLCDSMKSKRGEPYDAEELDSDMDRLRVLLLGRNGYFRASVGPPEIEDRKSGVRIVVPMHEGALFRWGTIKVEDSTVFTPEEVTQIFGLKSGEIADGYGVQDGLTKLETLYRDRGYAQSNVGFIPDFKQTSPDAEEGVVDITFEIEEGELFRIDAIQFEGNTRTSDRALRRRLLIHEGDIYNDSLIRESLARLNALGLFEKLTLGDIGIHITKFDRKQLDITIRLREKGRE